MTFNVWTFLFEVLNFLVLAYLLHRLLYRPLHDAIDARRAEANRARAEAEQAHREAVALQERLQREQAEQQRQQQELIRASREQADAERRRILAEAEQAVRTRQEEVRQALECEREDALQALRTEVVRQAVDAAGRLLGAAADRTLEVQLAARLVEAVGALPEDQRRQLREQWTPADGALLEAASDPDADALGRVRAALAELLGRPAELDVRVRPELLAGARLRLGGHVWDASLAGQLAPASNGRAKEARRV